MSKTLARCYPRRNSKLLVARNIAGCYDTPMDVKQIRFENFKRLLDKEPSQRAFADKTGLAVAFISQIHNRRRPVGDDAARRIESAFNFPRGWMDKAHGNTELPTEFANLVSAPRNKGMVPVISWVQAGELTEAVDLYEPGDAEEWLPCPRSHGRHTFALRVRGDSMTNPYPGQRSYPEGTLIYVDPDEPVENGRRVVAKLLDSDEVTFKVYAEDAGRRFLKPLNPQYPTLELTDGYQIVGVVIGSYLPE